MYEFNDDNSASDTALIPLFCIAYCRVSQPNHQGPPDSPQVWSLPVPNTPILGIGFDCLFGSGGLRAGTEQKQGLDQYYF